MPGIGSSVRIRNLTCAFLARPFGREMLETKWRCSWHASIPVNAEHRKVKTNAPICRNPACSRDNTMHQLYGGISEIGWAAGHSQILRWLSIQTNVTWRKAAFAKWQCTPISKLCGSAVRRFTTGRWKYFWQRNIVIHCIWSRRLRRVSTQTHSVDVPVAKYVYFDADPSVHRGLAQVLYSQWDVFFLCISFEMIRSVRSSWMYLFLQFYSKRAVILKSIIKNKLYVVIDMPYI